MKIITVTLRMAFEDKEGMTAKTAEASLIADALDVLHAEVVIPTSSERHVDYPDFSQEDYSLVRDADIDAWNMRAEREL